MKKLDLRVKRTNKYIIEAFIRLVEEKGFEQSLACHMVASRHHCRQAI